MNAPLGGDCEVCGLPWSMQVALQPSLAASALPAQQEASRPQLPGCTRCPLCGLELPEPALGQEHLDLHRIAGDNVDEALELARLRRRYGLDADPDNASYEQQYAHRLEAQVARGKLTDDAAAEQIARMHADIADCAERAAVVGIIPQMQEALEWAHRPTKRQGAEANGRSTNGTRHDDTSALATTSLSSEITRGLGELSVSASQRGVSWVLCGDGVVHSHGGFGDSGWGCGYRNIQMLSGFLMACGAPHEEGYRRTLFQGAEQLPPIPRLQEWLDRAWEAGFDCDGAEQLEGSVAHSKKLIGATECATLLRFFGVRASVCSFSAPAVPAAELEQRRQRAAIAASEDNAALPERKKPKQPQHVPAFEPCVELLEFCWSYFAARQHEDAETGPPPFCPPLYLQHEGHSRTVVGAERDQRTGSISLLLFDPAQESEAIQADVRDRRRLQRLRRGAQTFIQPRYQVCVVAPGLASEEERGRLKLMREVSPAEALGLPLR